MKGFLSRDEVLGPATVFIWDPPQDKKPKPP